MRILQLGKFYPFIGGVNKVLFDIADGLNKKKIFCDVLCSSIDNYKQFNPNPFSTVYCTSTFGYVSSTHLSPQLIFKLNRIKNKYDIIHVHHPDPLAALALYITKPKCKIVLHWHSDIIKQKKALFFFSFIQNWLLKRADRIIATTPSYVKGSTYLKKHKEKIVIIPIGIDKNDKPVNHKKVQEIRNRFNGKKIILSIGRFCYYKGFEYLIDSACYLDDKYVIVIGGDGYLKRKLEKQIIKKNLKEKVYLIGKLNDSEIGSYYASCDIFCLSSVERSEAFGIVQIEAMSFGKPIVATKISGSGVDWVNEDEVSGINVPPRNSLALSKAFVKILSNINLYNKLSDNSAQRYERLFTKDKMIIKTINLYQDLLKEVWR